MGLCSQAVYIFCVTTIIDKYNTWLLFITVIHIPLAYRLSHQSFMLVKLYLKVMRMVDDHEYQMQHFCITSRMKVSIVFPESNLRVVDPHTSLIRMDEMPLYNDRQGYPGYM